MGNFFSSLPGKILFLSTAQTEKNLLLILDFRFSVIAIKIFNLTQNTLKLLHNSVFVCYDNFRQSGLVSWGVTSRIERILVQTPIGAWPGFGTQHCYEVPGDLRVKIST